jgi:hypothetical protein
MGLKLDPSLLGNNIDHLRRGCWGEYSDLRVRGSIKNMEKIAYDFHNLYSFIKYF